MWGIDALLGTGKPRDPPPGSRRNRALSVHRDYRKGIRIPDKLYFVQLNATVGLNTVSGPFATVFTPAYFRERI